MKNFGAYVMWSGYSKIMSYCNAHNIKCSIIRDDEGGYDIDARVTPDQYSELEALFN